MDRSCSSAELLDYGAIAVYARLRGIVPPASR